MYLSKLALSIADSPTLRLNEQAGKMREAGQPVIHLGGGEPESDTPKTAIEAAKKKLDTGKVKYTPVSGTKGMKKAVISYTERHYGKTVLPENVLISGGAKQALYNLFVAVLNPGDEVVFPAPYWVSYPEMVSMTGGTPVVIKKRPGTFEPTIEDIKAAFSPKTRILILNSPNNPSGAVYSAALVEAAVRLCEEKGVYLVMDDIYHQLVFDGKKAPSCYAYSKNPDNIVVINGISKLYGMTGFRIGWAVAQKDVIKAMNKIQGQTTSCPSDLSQTAAAAALEGDQSCIGDLIHTLEDSRNALLQELKKFSKIKVTAPQGTFYCLPDFSGYNADSNALCAFLLEKAMVVTVPGKDFGCEGHLRLSYCGKKEDIVEGARRIFWAIDPAAPKTISIGGKTFERTWL